MKTKQPKTDINFIYYQPNPDKKKDAGDCVVRAICKATNVSWDKVYMALCNIGYKLKVMPNSDEAWKDLLIKNGFVYHKIRAVKGSKRGTVSEFAQNHPEGTYILSIANHLVSVVDGKYYDTWDCGAKSLYGWWEKQV